MIQLSPLNGFYSPHFLFAPSLLLPPVLHSSFHQSMVCVSFPHSFFFAPFLLLLVSNAFFFYTNNMYCFFVQSATPAVGEVQHLLRDCCLDRYAP